MVIGLMVVQLLRIKRWLMLSSAGYTLKGMWGVEVKRQVECWVRRKVCATDNGLGFISR